MVSKPPTFSARLQSGIQKAALKIAALAGYEGARPSRSFNSPTRVGSNPNSTIAQLQRTRLSLQGEEIIKNTSFGRNYIAKRRAYCSSGISYHPDTGDAATNKLVSDYCTDQWKRMGVNSSMQQTFGICADALLPQYGDCALRWIRSEEGNPNSELRLLAITGDRIGEVYRYVAPVVKNNITYYCGLFFDGPNIIQYRIYERWYDTTYIRPEPVDASDIIFFIDPIDTGVRGVSIFSACIDDIRSNHEILKATKDTMQQQSKIAAIASNNSGAAPEYTYDTQVNTDGTVEYQETFADGAVMKYQFNGDSYQVLRAEHPSQDFIGALRYLDSRGSLACNFPYEFLFSGAESGGAPFRGAFEAAGREIERLRNDVHRPRLDIISYVTIMDGVERRLLPARNGITKGSWQFTTLPSADAFRDDKSDIASIRAGITSPQRVIANNLGTTADVILSETKEWAIMCAKTVEDANRELVRLGYKPTVTPADVAQTTDNPVQYQQAENISQGKPADGQENPKGEATEKPVAAMAAPHDVSGEKRDDSGKWTSGGGGAKKSENAKEPADKTGDKPGEHRAEEPHRDKPDGGSSEGADSSHVKLTNSRVLAETDKALKVKVSLREGSMPIWIPKSHASVSNDGTVHVAQWVLDAKHKEFDSGFNPELHGEQIQTGNPPKPPTAEELAQREAESIQWMKEAAERNERNQKARAQKAAKKEKELTPEQIASRELEAKKQAAIKTSRRNAFVEAQADYFANKELPGKENAEKRKAKKEEFLKDTEFVNRQLNRLDSGLAPRGWEDAVIKKAESREGASDKK